MRLRVLVDQMVGKDGLLGEAGWSVLLETPRGCLILDAGMGRVLEHNLRFLGVDPAQASGQPEGTPNPGDPTSSAPKEDVVEADYEIVDDSKKS